MKQVIDINTFKKSSNFYGKIRLLVSVKSFDLEAIRKRYLASRNSAKNITGSVERRKKALGGIAYIEIENGELSQCEVLVETLEPRGLDYSKGRVAFSSENAVFILDNKKSYQLKNEWFSYIHTVKFSPFAPEKVLISSSGLDCFFEYNYLTNKELFSWFAWENGFNEGFSKELNTYIKLTKNPKQALAYEKENIPYQLIKDPLKDTLPTAQRAAFINSVYYNPLKENNWVATLFHKGKVIAIDPDKSTNLFENLKSPHGGKIISKDLKMVTNTAEGKVIIQDNGDELFFDFHNLEANSMHPNQWLQNSLLFGDQVLTIDSNRNAFVCFNYKDKVIDQIPFHSNWAIQDLTRLDDDFDLGAFKTSLNKLGI